MGRPAIERLATKDATLIRKLVHEGEAIGAITHADIDRKLGRERNGATTWTANVLNRGVGISPRDGYLLLHGLLKAVPPSKAGRESGWRRRVVEIYDRLQPRPDPKPAPSIPLMYVPEVGIDDFAKSLREFLHERGVRNHGRSVSTDTCKYFLTRRSPGITPSEKLTLREYALEELVRFIEEAVDAEVPIGTVSRDEFMNALLSLDEALAETRRRRRPAFEKRQTQRRRVAARKRLAKASGK